MFEERVVAMGDARDDFDWTVALENAEAWARPRGEVLRLEPSDDALGPPAPAIDR